MKKAKDRYLINRTRYKDIKRYDHQQMELQDVEKALQDVKGIGPVVWNRINERLAELFRKEQS